MKKELTFEERRESEIDKIQELYKFPIAFIEMYDIHIGASKDVIIFTDGVSMTAFKMEGVTISERASAWDIYKSSSSIEVYKNTRRINTFML